MFQTERERNNVGRDRCEAWLVFFNVKVQKSTRCDSKTVGSSLLIVPRLCRELNNGVEGVNEAFSSPKRITTTPCSLLLGLLLPAHSDEKMCCLLALPAVPVKLCALVVHALSNCRSKGTTARHTVQRHSMRWIFNPSKKGGRKF